MKITIETTPNIRETHRGKDVELNDEIKEMIKDNLIAKFEDIWEIAFINGQLKDVLISFDNINITNIEF